MIRVAVCDDNEAYLQQIRKILLSYFEERKIEGEVVLFSSGERLLGLGKKLSEFQLVLLDVELEEERDGVEIAVKIRKLDENLPIAFVSSHLCHSTKGYLVNAYRYVLKNDLEALLCECMDCLIEKIKKSQRRFSFNFQEGNLETDILNLVYVESQGHLLNCHLKHDETTEIFHLQEKLDHLQVRLSQQDFIRIHKSFLVNAYYIREIKNYCVTLQSGERLPIPKDKYRDVVAIYQKYRRKW